MKTAIMQPTFIPWMGYFALLASVDHFVFLDDVQYVRRSWQSRNRIKSAHGELMLSLPVACVHSKLRIDEALIAPSHNHKKLLKRLSSSYSKAPYGLDSISIIDAAYQCCGDSLAAFNIGIISSIAQLCGCSTRLSKASDIPDITGTKGQRLYNICSAIGASEYVSPIGSHDYLKTDNPFSGSSIELRFLNFTHPTYPQGAGPFLPNMGIVDALAWSGPRQLSQLLNNSVGTLRSIDQQAACEINKAA